MKEGDTITGVALSFYSLLNNSLLSYCPGTGSEHSPTAFTYSA